MTTRQAATRTISAVSVPWTSFVAAFLYYTLLSVVVISGADLSGAFVVFGYALPVGAYVAALMIRGVRALAALEVDLAHTPHAIAR